MAARADGTGIPDFARFFSSEKAKATLITDVKIDDALALWYFIWLSCQRPNHHNVDVQIFVTGISDSCAAVSLAEHVCTHAREQAGLALQQAGRAAASVKFKVFASKCPAETTPRHEVDTYRPYNDSGSGFPQAASKQGHLEYWQDLTQEEAQADLVWIFAQFFNFELAERQAESETIKLKEDMAEILKFALPSPRGLLCIQFGFNTLIKGGALADYQLVWSVIKDRVRAIGCRVLTISNSFSFAKDGKPGRVEAQHPFLESLKALPGEVGELWRHLVDAGLKEGLLFACDQMAKWLTRTDVEADWEKDGLGDALNALAHANAVPLESKEAASSYLKTRFVLAQDKLSTGETNEILAMDRELHSIVKRICGERAADYLGRSCAVFENYGMFIEATDGLHMVAAMQQEVPVFVGADLRPNSAANGLDVYFDDAHDGLIWAAKNVSVQRSIQWMEQLQDVAKVGEVFASLRV